MSAFVPTSPSGFNARPLCRQVQKPLVYDGVDAPPTASMCQSGDVEHHLREASVSKVIMIGLDIAKYVFHVHGAVGLYSASGSAGENCWISLQPSRIAR